MSLCRNANQWLVVTLITTVLNVAGLEISLLCSVQLTCADLQVFQGDRVYVYNVSAEHSVSDEGFVLFGGQNLAGLACTRIGDDTYVALSLPEASLVTLHRLVWPSPTPSHSLANFTLTTPTGLLFRRDLLLVSDSNSTTRSHGIVSVRTSGGALSEKRVLLTAADHIAVLAWTLAGDRLVLWDLNSGDLLIYAFA